MIIVKVFLLSCCASVVLSGGTSQCEPFYSNYFEFLEKFLKSVEKRKEAIIADIHNYSFYANASIVEAEITSENYYQFFINVTAHLANMTTEIVEGSLNGTITTIPGPLSCVSGSFEIVNDILRESVNKTLNVAASISHPSPSSNSSNCTDINTMFPMYAVQLQEILDKRTKLNHIDAETFAQFTESLIALNIAQNENQFKLMVTALAGALKIDINFAKELISGHFTNLPSSMPSASP